MKYADDDIAYQLSGIKSYPAINREAVQEMHRQVGDLQNGHDGIAVKGLIIRHLVLPYGLAGTEQIVRFISQSISPHSYVNIMDQYHPCHKAYGYDKLNRSLSVSEYQSAIDSASRAGLDRLDNRKVILRP